MNESQLREQATAGARLKEHLSEIHSGLDAIERQFADEWAKTFDADHRENLWGSVQIVRKLKSHFGEIVSAGTVATHQLTELKRLK